MRSAPLPPHVCEGPSGRNQASVVGWEGRCADQVPGVELARGPPPWAGERGAALPRYSLHSDAHGVYQLAMLLTELDRGDEASGLLGADALYRLGRLDDAHKALLVALSQRPRAAPVLARLALLQLRRGFFHDAHQVRRPHWATAPWRAPGPLASLCNPQPGLRSGQNLSQPRALPPRARPLASVTLSLFIRALVFRVFAEEPEQMPQGPAGLRHVVGAS